MKIITGRIFVLILLAALAGTARADTTPGSNEDLRAGFFLLHQVCDQESQVDMLNIIKTTPPEVGDYVKRVSALAKKSEATLDRFADGDSALRTRPIRCRHSSRRRGKASRMTSSISCSSAPREPPTRGG